MTADHEGSRSPDLLVSMQDALLPTGVVPLPGVDVEAQYLLADGASAGGDWFDAVPLPGGRVALVVGDVVGRGTGAAALMGHLRAVLVAGLLAAQEPVVPLQTLDALTEVLPEARGATVVVAVVDPGQRAMSYCTVGHPPPLVAGDDGQCSFLAATGSGPLGWGTTFRAAEHPLDPGDLVLLYSDGLVTRPGVRPRVGTAHLLEVVSGAVLDRAPAERSSIAERVCKVVLDRVARETGVDDDVTVVAAQLLGPPEPDLVLDLPALPDSVRVVRLELGSWLAALRLSALDQMALQHAAGELVANVVQHAYPSGSPARDTTVRVTAVVADDGFVVVDVQDHGTWRVPNAAVSGSRGLAMASGFVDHLDAVPSARGTHMRVRHRALRPARLLSQGSAPPARPGAPDDVLTIGVGESGGLTLIGAVDPISVDRLAAELRSSAAGPGGPLDVDLSRVTALCSAGVQVLLDAVARGPRPGRRPVVLHAASGTVAQHVLELVQLPYEEPSGPPGT